MTTSLVVIEEKACSICGEIKPITEFYRHNRNGYESNCKKCKPRHAEMRQKAQQQMIRDISAKIDQILPSREQNTELFYTQINPHLQSLIEELVYISLNGEKDGDRLKAIQYVLDRLLGKADQQITVKTSGPSQADNFLDMWKTEDIIDVTPE